MIKYIVSNFTVSLRLIRVRQPSSAVHVRIKAQTPFPIFKPSL